MKTPGIIATILASAFAAFGQTVGVINARTDAGANTRWVYACDVRAGGTDYLVQVYYADGIVSDPSALRAADYPPFSPRTGPAAGVLGSHVLVLQLQEWAGIATIQIRMWSAILGASYQEAWENWILLPPSMDRVLGESALFSLRTGPPNSTVPMTPPSIAPFFPGLVATPSIGCVPEPSTLALALSAALPILLFLATTKRKQSGRSSIPSARST